MSDMTTRILRRIAAASAITATSLLSLAGCREEEPDAYGNFEAEEVVVSAETGGQLLAFEVTEGRRVDAGATVGAIDTTQLVLQRRELLARRTAARSRTSEVGAQIGVLTTQHDVARREYERTRRLFESQAATAQQLDRAEREYRTLAEQIAATRTSRGTAQAEVGSIDAQIARLDDRIGKSRIENPVGGTVLTTYVRRGELVQPGQPLYKLADLDTLTLRAYVSGAQLASVRLGQAVEVRVDAGADSMRTLPGRVTWIASEAEFTPTPIQTRDERVDQVYAVKIRVPNPGGMLRIGMPAELVIPAGTGGGEPPDGAGGGGA
jgi:HlyD family secretion protein